MSQANAIGFTDSDRSGLPARAQSLTIAVQNPEVSFHSNATIPVLAALPPGPTPGTRFFGGVYDQSGGIIPESRLWRGDRCYVDAAAGFSTASEVQSDEEVIYGGVQFLHFGHMMVEGLARLWYCQDEASTVPVCVQATTRGLSRATQQLFELIGLTARVRLIARPARFSRVIIPDPAFVMHKLAHVAFKSLCVGLADRALRGEAWQISERPIYLSRSRLPPSQRAVFGEELLEKLLMDNGVAVVHVQELDLRTQMRLVNCHRHILGPLGSAFHLLLFSRIANRATYLVESAPPPTYRLCDALNSTQATYIRSTSLIPPPFVAEGLDGTYLPQLLDLERVATALINAGVIKRGVFEDGASQELVRRYRRSFLLRALAQSCERKLANVIPLAEERVRKEFADDQELKRELDRARQVCAAAGSG